jgi:hypothetical protein
VRKMVQVPAQVPVHAVEITEAGLHCEGSFLHKCTQERYRIPPRHKSYRATLAS